MRTTKPIEKVMIKQKDLKIKLNDGWCRHFGYDGIHERSNNLQKEKGRKQVP